MFSTKELFHHKNFVTSFLPLFLKFLATFSRISPLEPSEFDKAMIKKYEKYECKINRNKSLENQYSKIQQILVDKIELYDKVLPEELQLISGVDLEYWRDNNVDYAVCCIVTLNYVTKEVIEIHSMIDSINVAVPL